MDRAPGLPPKSVPMPTGPETTGSTSGVDKKKNPLHIGSSTGPKKSGTTEGMGEAPKVEKKSTPEAKSTNKKGLEDAKPKTHWWNKAGAWFHAKGHSIKQWFSDKWQYIQKCFSGEQAEKAEQCVNNIASAVSEGVKNHASLDCNSLAENVNGLSNLAKQIPDGKNKTVAQHEAKNIQNAVETVVADAHQADIEDIQTDLDTDHFQAAKEQGINPMSDPLDQLIDLADKTCGLAGEIAQRALKNINGVKMPQASIDFLKECYVGGINQPPELPKNWNDFQSGLEALKKDSPEIANYVCQQLFETNDESSRLVDYFANNLLTEGNLDRDGFPKPEALVEFGKQLAYIDSVSDNVADHESNIGYTGGKTLDLGDKVFQKLLEKKDSEAKDTETQKLFGQGGNMICEKRAQFLGPKFEAVGKKLEQIETLEPDQKNRIMNLLCKSTSIGLSGLRSSTTNNYLYDGDGKANFDMPDWFCYNFDSNTDEEFSGFDLGTSDMTTTVEDLNNQNKDLNNQKTDILQKKYGLCGQIAQQFIAQQKAVHEEPSDTLELTRASMDFLGACYVNGPSQPPQVPETWEAFQSELEALKKDNPKFANYVCQQLFRTNHPMNGSFANYFTDNLSKNLDEDGFPNAKALVEFGKQLEFIDSVSPEVVSSPSDDDVMAPTYMLGGCVFSKLKDSKNAQGKPTQELFKRVFSDDKDFKTLKDQQSTGQVPFLKGKLESVGQELDQDQTLNNDKKNEIMNLLFDGIIHGLVANSTQNPIANMHKILNPKEPTEKANFPAWFKYGEDE